MGTQRLQRRDRTRTPFNSNKERQKQRRSRARRAHEIAKRIGAGKVLELVVLAAAAKPESEA